MGWIGNTYVASKDETTQKYGSYNGTLQAQLSKEMTGQGNSPTATTTPLYGQATQGNAKPAYVQALHNALGQTPAPNTVNNTPVQGPANYSSATNSYAPPVANGSITGTMPTNTPAPSVPTTTPNVGATTPQVAPAQNNNNSYQAQTYQAPTNQVDPDKWKRVNDIIASLPKYDKQGAIDSYTQSNNSGLEGAIAQIYKARDSAINKQNTIIEQAPEQYQTYRNQADVSGAQNVKALREYLSLIGASGSGMGLSALSKAQASAGNQIAGFNKQQQDLINTSNRSIAETEANAGYDETTARSEASARLSEMLAKIGDKDYDANYRQISDTLASVYNMNRADVADSQSDRAFDYNKFSADRTFDYGKFSDDRTYGMQEKTFDENVKQFNVGQDNFNKTFDQTQGNWDKSFEQSQGNWDKTFNQAQANDDRSFNANQSAQMGYVNPTAGMNIPDEARQALSQYQGNYAQASIDLAQSNPELAKYAKMLSNEKLFNDADLLRQYGGQFQTMQGKQLESGLETDMIQRAGLVMENAMRSIQLESLPQETQLKLQIAQLQVQAGELDNATKTIQNANLDEQLKATIAGQLQQVASSKSGDSLGWANYGLAKTNAETKASNASAKANSASTKITAQDKTGYRAQAFQQIKGLSVKDAQGALVQKREEIESILGTNEYIKLWNDVLGPAISKGQAMEYGDY